MDYGSLAQTAQVLRLSGLRTKGQIDGEQGRGQGGTDEGRTTLITGRCTVKPLRGGVVTGRRTVKPL